MYMLVQTLTSDDPDGLFVFLKSLSAACLISVLKTDRKFLLLNSMYALVAAIKFIFVE